ncbi:NAD(P)/FAD-dependent oxidoreductase [Streptomyces sp. RS10V-4]|uniref:NAD(P)/FAD-dependent oxidoreductase n=1 Tax=Streptomyces rhizoryzae TaxID=2932493 RepID=UPI00200471DC|nr:FAD/NAD(P)-binding oxidoreductase [Streptomyces rhizoryzae]MCK7622139.1 NAD(P)/FAD-dependent oxidoreductase [Streptomyces rhizoryzae]
MSEQSKSSEAPDRTPRVVIAGAGMAGVQTAVALREQGWRGAITLLGDEPHQPYDRPPLSKAVLLGKADGATLDVDFPGLGIDLHLGRRATALRPADQVVETDRGPVRYDYAVLATGAVPVRLPGTEGLAGVHLLRTLDDAERLRPELTPRRRIVVVGAGWIGAEFATAAREAGCEVTVVEAADRPLAGALPPEVAGYMTGWYGDAGAELRTGVPVASVAPGAVTLADGTVLPADAVVVGIGARPATAWLAGSGVALSPADGSVLADERLRTSVPGVYAVGDCASFPSARYGTRLLVHHWDNALQGPRTVAENIARGEAEGVVYDPVPYFWSEQFGRFVQYAGHHGEADELVWRGDPTGAAWSVLWLRREDGPDAVPAAGRLVALLAVGRPRDLAQGRRLIERGALLDRERAADATVPLKSAVR